MAEFDPIESEFLDFAQHAVARGMSAGIPAGGKRDHWRSGNDDRFGRRFCFGSARARLVASLPSGCVENDERANTEEDGGRGQGRSHTDEIGQSGNAQSGDGHKSEEAQAEHGGNPPPQGEGARSCTMVLARAKFIDNPMAKNAMEPAVRKKLCERAMENNAAATAMAFAVMN